MSLISEEIYKTIVDTLDEALFLTDNDGHLIELNELAISILRVSPKLAIGKSLADLLNPETANFLMQQGKDALVSGKERSVKKKAITLPGRGFRFYSIRINPIRRVSEDPYLAFFLRDITIRVRRETATEKARENAEADASARQAFLARMSHEIRTPMNGIMGMTDLALQSESSAELAECLAVIKSASESLLIIINDVLDFAKFESGRMQLESLPIRLESQIDETIALLKPAADEKGITIEAEVQTTVPEILYGDPTRLRQILINLIGNAIKFTDHGTVKVALAEAPPLPGQSTDELILVGTVSDSGIGIEPARLQSIFDPFVQGDNSISREYGGTGLGLAICHSLVQLMGGTLEAQSFPGEGSTFRFQIILKKAAAMESPLGDTQVFSADSVRWNGEKILLAEDNRVNRRVAEKLLQKAGLSVISCNDGKQAIIRWKKEKPALILMDLQMPVMDGLKATRAIRQSESDENLEPVPIIALTAHVLEEERQKASEAGMSGWVGKPLRPAELFQELARFVPPMLNSRNTPSGRQGSPK